MNRGEILTARVVVGGVNETLLEGFDCSISDVTALDVGDEFDPNSSLVCYVEAEESVFLTIDAGNDSHVIWYELIHEDDL